MPLPQALQHPYFCVGIRHAPQLAGLKGRIQAASAALAAANAAGGGGGAAPGERRGAPGAALGCRDKQPPQQQQQQKPQRASLAGGGLPPISRPRGAEEGSRPEVCAGGLPPLGGCTDPLQRLAQQRLAAGGGRQPLPQACVQPGAGTAAGSPYLAGSVLSNVRYRPGVNSAAVKPACVARLAAAPAAAQEGSAGTPTKAFLARQQEADSLDGFLPGGAPGGTPGPPAAAQAPNASPGRRLALASRFRQARHK